MDNGSDHRAGTTILQAEKFARKPGFACITLLSGTVCDLEIYGIADLRIEVPVNIANTQAIEKSTINMPRKK